MKFGTKRDAVRPIARFAFMPSMWLLAFIGAGAGYALGMWLFPRSDTWQNVLAGLGVVVGYLLWRPIGIYLQRWM